MDNSSNDVGEIVESDNARADPDMDLVGPGIGDDVRRLISRYGADAIKTEVKVQTRRKPGMPTKGDWKILEKFLKEDARLWLEGGNPFRRGADNSVATWFAAQYPDKNVQSASTYKRVYRKLRKHRRYYTFVEAFWMSDAGHPYQRHLEMLRELCSASKIEIGWQSVLEQAEGTLRDYRIKFGRLPPSKMTMREVEDAAKVLIPGSRDRRSNVLQGLLGARRRPHSAN